MTRRVLVTGASGAFGAPTMQWLRARGAEVRGLDLRSDDTAVICCDITDDDAVRSAVKRAAAELGGLDAVVHYAGIGLPNDAGQPPHPTAAEVLDVNLLGAWRVTAAALPWLLTRDDPARARAVFVASELAYVPLPFASAYSVAKRGMTAYADALRVEYGSHLHVSTVYPGYVRTPIHAAAAELGLALEGQVRREEVDDVLGTVLRVLAAARPPRDTACTPAGKVELWAARHLPGLVAAGVRHRVARRAAAGGFDSAPLAAGLVGRLTGRTTDGSLR